MSSEDSGTVCRLVPIPDETDTPEFPIELRDHEAVVLGRSLTTGIKDKKLSRHQVEVTADWTKKTLKCKQLGSNPSLANRAILAKDEICLLKDGQTLHLLLGRFQYRIEFSNKKVCDESFLKDISKTAQKNSTPSVMATNIPNSDPAEAGDNASTFKTEILSKAKKRPMSTDDTLVDEKKHLAKRSKMEEVTDQDGQDQEEDDIDQKLEALRKQAKEYNNKTSLSSKSPATSSGKATGERAAMVEKKKGPEKLQQGEAWDTGPQWEEHGSLVVYTCDGVRAGNWIAGFDMDGTIITTQSGKVFPTSISDWRILYPDIPGKLKKLHAQGYKVMFFTNQVMFFTNQLGVGRGKTTLSDMKQKVTSIIKKLGVPIQVMMATGSGVYRKPAVGMWTYLLDKANDGISVDMTTSLYAGDAAGRPVNWKPKTKKDFSCSDRLFALNVGLKFYTPEEYFLGHKKAPFNLPPFNPRTVPIDIPLLNPATTELPSLKQEVLILVGFPASGKSTFVKNHLLEHNYVHINRDMMGTWQKCVSSCTAALNRGQSVVIDNTNPDMESRKRYIDCAKKKAGVMCRCFVFQITMEQARHNERFRQISDTVKDHATIKDMVYYSYRNKYIEPSPKEGIDEVVKVNFVPSFSDEKDRTLYRMWLLEK